MSHTQFRESGHLAAETAGMGGQNSGFKSYDPPAIHLWVFQMVEQSRTGDALISLLPFNKLPQAQFVEMTQCITTVLYPKPASLG